MNSCPTEPKPPSRRNRATERHRIVREHLETFLAHARESYDRPLPKYVRNELKGYLRCGIFDHGFTRARCDACGYDLLVAFSCKARGLCPSCAGRRMANTTAHLVDRVFPSVPVRQWVLSLPFDVRARAAFDAKFLTLLVRAFASSLSTRHERWARGMGIERSAFAAVTFVQRFGSSLNLNVHLHVAVVDGVFSRDDRGGICFTAAPPPTYAEMLTVVRAVGAHVAKLAVTSTSADEGGTEHPLDACARIALSRGDVRAVTAELEDTEEISAPASHDGAAVDDSGFNLEASVRIGVDDDFGREHLLRYCARPPIALGRLIALPHGKIGYRIKKLRNGRAKLRILTPLELLARLAALVPPPRHPLVRFHGAFAPRSSWRRAVVPKPRESVPKTHAHTPTPPPPQTPPARPRSTPCHSRQSAVLLARTESLSPNVLGVHHWDRLKSGALLATSPRIDWATLMRRTFDVDVLECPKCTGKLRVLAIVEDETLAATILTELGLARAPPLHRARDPATLDADPSADDPC